MADIPALADVDARPAEPADAGMAPDDDSNKAPDGALDLPFPRAREMVVIPDTTQMYNEERNALNGSGFLVKVRLTLVFKTATRYQFTFTAEANAEREGASNYAYLNGWGNSLTWTPLDSNDNPILGVNGAPLINTLFTGGWSSGSYTILLPSTARKIHFVAVANANANIAAGPEKVGDKAVTLDTTVDVTQYMIRDVCEFAPDSTACRSFCIQPPNAPFCTTFMNAVCAREGSMATGTCADLCTLAAPNDYDPHIVYCL